MAGHAIIKITDVLNAFDNLDGALINAGIESVKTQNKNDYFLGFIGVALGLASVLFGLLYYADFVPVFRLSNESWFFLVFGLILFVAGVIPAVKASVFKLTLDSFLRSAKFTRCNIKCSVDTRFYKEGGIKDSYYQSFYTVAIFYIDNKGQKRKKTVKWLLAYKYYHKRQQDFENEPPFLALNDCVVAYNEKGKALLID